MVKALFTYNYGEEKMKKIKDLGYDITYIHESELVYNESIEDIEVLVCYNPFNTLDITKMKKLKWIQLSSIGIDQVPLDYVKEKEIIVTNNKGGYSIPMGEWVVLKILELIKRSKSFYNKQNSKTWKLDTSVLELFGKTVGFIGTGSIAKESAKRLQGFEVNILGINTSGRDVEYFNKCYSINEINKILPLCDIVVLTIPYTEKTHHLFNKSTFKMMKNNSYFINVSRGNIVNEKDLIESIKNRKVKGAALDVFEKEPLDKNSPLWDMEEVIITPHNSWVSEMRNERRYNLIYKNMKRYINKQQLFNVVNLNKGY
ncbi:phosphoglycerate dehydrogenase [Thermohalobacter berrensis]|uniref:Dihydrofolate reductase n=1 Tax=Thermohalobacter berrensis TaxID=99594 RepID=A0A419TB47_9FIRM|nr:phosphoglycerate dehydrogenase [Thermohalobacter berrensis]RKD34709.1 dihydrofolate reductase [Thermohalobacter berrensis]